MSEYNQRLIEWTNMKEEKQYTFTITEEDLQRLHSGPHLKSIKHPSQSMSHSEGDLRKYQALPPIGITEIRVEIVNTDAVPSFFKRPLAMEFSCICGCPLQ